TAIDGAAVAVIGHAGIELAREHHRADALLRRNLVDGDAGRRLEADRAGVATRRQALHEENHVGWSNPEFVVEDAAGPQRRSHHVFRHANTLAFEIGWAVDMGVLTDEHDSVVEAPRRKHWDPDKPFVIPSADNHEL